jgi:hypothetical protein
MDVRNKVHELLDKLFAEYQCEMIPAAKESIAGFRRLAAEKGVPSSVIDQLAAFYEVTNGVPCLDSFDFHRCDDIILFEWWDHQELWLGQRDMDNLRWAKAGFCLGDAGDASYGPEYEFATLLELIEKCLEEWYDDGN